MKRQQWFLIIILLIAAFFIRFYKVDQIPNGLYYDEIDAGYQARSIIQTGKDYRGFLSTFYFRSFLDPRPPIPIYFTAISTLIFQTPELQVRMASVILGVVNVGLAFWLMFQWFKKFRVAALTAFVYATNPWMIQFSRFNHEANSVIFFTLLGLNLFYLLLSTKKIRYLFLSSAIFSLGMYTYRTMSLFVPLIFLILFLIYKKELLKFGIKKIVLAVLLVGLITVPFLYATTIGAPDKPRIAQISIFSEPLIPILIQRNRELDSNDENDHSIGKHAAPTAYFFHNKPLSDLAAFTTNYLQTFSMDFLFIKGDQNHRHSIEGQGMLFYIDMLALGFGLFYLFSNIKDKKFKLLLCFLLISPIPASLTSDGAGHGARLITFSIYVLILVGIGWDAFLTKISSYKYSNLYFFSVAGIWILLFIFYLHNYFIHFPINAANMFGFGYKQATQKIMEVDKNYKKVELTEVKDPPILYFIFWANIPPKQIQEYGTQFSNDIIKNQPMDKYKASNLPIHQKLPDLLKSMEPDTLYLVTGDELPVDLRNGKTPPTGINLIDTITYPDGEADFYLISKAINGS